MAAERTKLRDGLGSLSSYFFKLMEEFSRRQSVFRYSGDSLALARKKETSPLLGLKELALK